MVMVCGAAPAFGQAHDLPSAMPEVRAGESPEARGRRLLDEMVAALGGPAWLNRGTIYREGSTAAFFRGQPTGNVTRYVENTRLASATQPTDLTRIAFKTYRGMVAPGQKKDIFHLWTADNGYEYTYKGRTELPRPQVEDYLRRRRHSIEEVIRTWIHAPGVMIVSEGTTTQDRRIVDKVTILSANNDAVTIEIDQFTHLPLERSFEWRNEQFKDHDIDEEAYSDYHVYQGVQTPMNITRYRNGDMVDQEYFSKVKYGEPMAPELFDPAKLEVK
ncbi:hypothetical protein [Granulicella rosea]|uniref:hypothetical protein n=1 Tax=Granulicella rosea TaxID=474952 RepID=UPI00115D8430|nr:hypothetical protein [Granulicella rosea]